MPEDSAANPGTPALQGVRVLEFEGAGPVPFCGMLLADLGADVVVVERAAAIEGPFVVPANLDVLKRGKRRIRLDLKFEQGRELAADLASRADVLLEGFRPGVMERLQLGPRELRASNARLVYGRVSGYGQTGPSAMRPGHDLNFLAESGALYYMGRADDVPLPPLNLIADFAGSGTLAATGVLAALLQARATGMGQVVDVSMLQACRLMMASICSWRATGLWREERGANFIDGSCPWYAVYRARDGAMLAIASLEPQFYATLVQVLDMAQFADAQWDKARWPQIASSLTRMFATRDRQHWLDLFAHRDACVSAVDPLPDADASREPPDGWHTLNGVVQPRGMFPALGIPPRSPTLEDAAAVLQSWRQPAQ
ncbi:MAG: CaiB/BaiF CoA-transferase family protein [Pseudomonadota bacterium]